MPDASSSDTAEFSEAQSVRLAAISLRAVL